MAKRLWPFLFLGMAGIIFFARAGRGNPLDGAGQRIEQVRKREAVIKILDESGGPAAGVTVRAEMMRHQFLFGCNIYMFNKLPTDEENDRYLELWERLFNYATVPFYFGSYQPTPEDTEESYLKEMVAWCRNRGVTVKGHPLIWHFPSSNPDWLPDSPARVYEIMQNRINGIVTAFSPDVEYWDVLNEPTTVWMYNNQVARWENGLGPLTTGLMGLEWAAAADPDATLLINDYNVKFDLWSFLPLFHPVRVWKMLVRSPVQRFPNSYDRYLIRLKELGGNFHAVGIQSHMHMGNWSMKELWDVCERYAKLGLPIHFTEVTILSGRHKIMQPFDPELNQPWPSTEKGERSQADYAEKFYTLLFSHPSVEAITWWDLIDRDAWMGAPAGLIRDDLTEKPAYERLHYLIKEKWWTRFEGRTDEQGYLKFRGFCGDYQLYVNGREEPIPFRIDCSVEKSVEFVVH
jgi:GH35 family endo-1,4-beta-xylanase